MEFRQLLYFLTVLQTGSFTQAAKKLNMAQPPLSRQIKNLEAILGVQLLTRSANGVTPTAAGKLLATYAQQLLELRDQADHQIRFAGTAVSGRLRLGLISSAVGLLPPKLASLTQYYPDIQLDIQEGNTYQLLEKLTARNLDAAIVRTPFSTEHIQSKALRTERIVAVVPNKYAKDLKATLDVAALEPLPLIVYRRFSDVFEQTFFAKNIRPFIACYCDDARTAVQWANAKLGVALVPESVATAYLGTGMQIHPINYQPWRTQIQLIWPDTVIASPILEKFIEIFDN